MNDFKLQVNVQPLHTVYGSPLKIKVGVNEVSVASERVSKDGTEYLSIHLAVFDNNNDLVKERQSPSYQDLIDAVEFAKTYNQCLDS